MTANVNITVQYEAWLVLI